MEIDTKIQRDVLSSIKNFYTSNRNEEDDIITKMSTVTTVEEFMRLKRRLMLITSYLPLGVENCYFCKKHYVPFNNRADGFDCNKCEYRRNHNNISCCEERSDYEAIVIACVRLRSEIMAYHRDGDTYTEIVPQEDENKNEGE
jgi:hypothetical protein